MECINSLIAHNLNIDPTSEPLRSAGDNVDEEECCPVHPPFLDDGRSCDFFPRSLLRHTSERGQEIEPFASDRSHFMAPELNV